MSAPNLEDGVENTSPDATEYRKIIQHLAAGSINQRIPNGKPIHAAILLEAMLKKASTDMRIFTGELSPPTYDDAGLIDAAQRFIERPGARLRILIQKKTDVGLLKQRPLVDALMKVKASQIIPNLQICFATGAYASDEAKHIAVMDDVGYRFETDHKNTAAVANFNEPSVAVELAAAFDRAFSMGTQAI